MNLTEKDIQKLQDNTPEDCDTLRIELSNSIRLHSNGEIDLIRKLIRTKLPSEPSGIMDYRLANIARITKTYFDKILSILKKPRNADDFAYKFPNKFTNDLFTKYFSLDFPSIFDWYYSVGIKSLLQNPNGYMLVLPTEIADIVKYATIKEVEAGIFDIAFGESVINGLLADTNPALVRDKLTIIILEENQILIDKQTYLVFKCNKDSETMIYIDNKEIGIIYKKDKTTSGMLGTKELAYVKIFDYTLKDGMLPYVKFGGNFFDVKYPNIYESFISGVVPFWNQAMVEFSDKQAALKQHVYPEKWRVKSRDCKDCSGTGQIALSLKGETATEICTSCSGTGMYNPPTGIFSEHIIDSSVFEQNVGKMPPVGYIQKDLKPIEFIDTDIDKMIYSGLSAVNMEFLMDVPLAQSGVAKEIDRGELNTFVRTVTTHAMNNNIMPLCKIITSWAYYDTQNFVEDTILHVPYHFDVINHSQYEEKILAAKNAGLDISIIKALENKYISSKFASHDETRQKLLLINSLNPLYGVINEDKITLLDKGIISEIDFFISSNIESLIDELINTTNGNSFFNMDLLKQKELLMKLAKKTLNKMKKAAKKEEPKENDSEDMIEDTTEANDLENNNQIGEDNVQMLNNSTTNSIVKNERETNISEDNGYGKRPINKTNNTKSPRYSKDV